MCCALRPVPRSTEGRASPIWSEKSPQLTVSPKPSCPAELSPQHKSKPKTNKAQVWLYPAAIEIAVCPVPSCTAGCALSLFFLVFFRLRLLFFLCCFFLLF